MNEVLFRKVERLKEEVLYLETNRKFLKEIGRSVDTKKIAERSVYLCAEITLDISDLVITIKGFPKPSTYSDSIYKLGDHKIIPKSFARKFAEIEIFGRLPINLYVPLLPLAPILLKPKHQVQNLII